jgi:mannose-6-phosphate isomerase-like protein (cupin superfamily)
MPKVSKNESQHMNHGPVEEWRGDVDGYTINIVRFGVDLDATPMLQGLPGNRCSCPHWGYVLKGRVTFTFDDRTEVHEAGDAFYVPAGHGQRVDAGTEYVQFSPAAELRTVSDVIASNMRRMKGG